MDHIHLVIIVLIPANGDFMILEPQFKTCRYTSDTNWLICDCNKQTIRFCKPENFLVSWVNLSP